MDWRNDGGNSLLSAHARSHAVDEYWLRCGPT